jgi:hypothetical protein
MSEKWQLDRKISIALIIVIFFQVGAVVEGEPGRLLGGPKKKKKTKWAKE